MTEILFIVTKVLLILIVAPAIIVVLSLAAFISWLAVWASLIPSVRFGGTGTSEGDGEN